MLQINLKEFNFFLYEQFFHEGYKADVETARTNQDELESSYQELCELAKKRRQMLEESLKLHTFYRDLEEEDIWLSEKEYFVSSTEYGSDINTTTLLLQQHNVSKKYHQNTLFKYKICFLVFLLAFRDVF